ncbi:acetate/propionate family kinase [Salinicola rhizosphaerae]|uniref:Acetate kinase n=1 Tax=Salinicola rhizosphaerae TaxID=1443141 RepID=A0ABQ3EHD0_9GAMM|nr:acetate/propionate family kinase [Salinicola rhizosphaerae]GHB34152.1 acetate kinase [Salinicola rhizosphaerae]
MAHSDVTLLALNAGSSSLKLSLYRMTTSDAPELVAHIQMEEIGDAPHLVGTLASGESFIDEHPEPREIANHDSAYAKLREALDNEFGQLELAAVGHRVVHGGDQFDGPTAIDDVTRERIASLTPMAPLHQPHHLEGMDAVSRFAPQTLQVACFDNTFHLDMPQIAQLTGLPYRFFDQGIRRYGFHGLSYEYIAETLHQIAPDLARGRVVAAHLGNGASLCAMHGGKSIDTTMSFTALDGLPMGTRVGALDPGVLLYLQQEHGYDLDALQSLLYHDSGLLGLSGVDSDMHALLSSDSPRARLAVEFFVHRTAQEIARLAVSLGGLDGIVFTAGIGEHAPAVRRDIMERLSPLCSVAVDDTANLSTNPGRISTPESRVAVHVIPTDEERMIARHTYAVWQSRQPDA